MQIVSKNQVSAKDEELVRNLKREVQHLKDILKIRKKGGENDITTVVYQLTEENNRLRKMANGNSEVEKLKEENKNMRIQLQKI